MLAHRVVPRPWVGAFPIHAASIPGDPLVLAFATVTGLRRAWIIVVTEQVHLAFAPIGWLLRKYALVGSADIGRARISVFAIRLHHAAIAALEAVNTFICEAHTRFSGAGNAIVAVRIG